MLEDLIAEAGRRGYLVNNLFQVDAATWQCNLRPAGRDPNYCRKGRTAAEALRAALDHVGPAYPGHVEPPVFSGGIFG